MADPQTTKGQQKPHDTPRDIPNREPVPDQKPGEALPGNPEGERGRSTMKHPDAKTQAEQPDSNGVPGAAPNPR